METSASGKSFGFEQNAYGNAVQQRDATTLSKKF